MFKRFFLFIIIIACFTSSFGSDRNSYDVQEKNVLIIHSYHQGLEWTDNITDGFLSVFDGRQDINLVFEYLDMKRFFDPEYKNSLVGYYRDKASKIPFDLVLISDNAAYDFLKEYHQEFYPSTPVVFCGINNLDTIDLKSLPDFYGFMERTDHKETLESIQTIFPERKNILIINDNTLTGQAIQAQVEAIIPAFEKELNIEMCSDFNLESLQQKILTLNQNYVIYLLVINRDNKGEFISYRKGIEAIKFVSNVPVFGSWDFYMNKGLFGGKITKGFDQGEAAAQMALNILDNGISDTLKQYNDIDNEYMFDHIEMRKFKITERDLPANSNIINQPNLLRVLMRVAVGVLTLLLILLIVASLRLRYTKKNAAMLHMLVEEKTKELNHTNEELHVLLRKKNQFFSILAHDLRNSLSSLLSASILINSKEYELKEEVMDKVKGDLLNSANQTSSLLEDLLYWGISQFKAKPTVSFSKIDVKHMFDSILKTYKVNTNGITFELQLQDDAVFYSDPNICKFICRNIIQNAIKYSHVNGVVLIDVDLIDEKIKISVTDDGIGMSLEVVQSIYDKDPIKRGGEVDQKSTGLGLPMVLEYLELLQGKMQIDSKEGEGSTFTLIIPNED